MPTEVTGREPSTACRVLPVEDHIDTRDMLARLLSSDYDVRTAQCYDSALSSALQAKPDVVVTDVGLPGRDGVMLMRELHRRYQVPGIAVTGHTPEDPGAYRDAGFVTCLTKPIQLDQLIRALNAACRPDRAST